MVNTDSTSGHGTHVAGIVAGQGSVDAAHKGVAPGARLYGLGVGEMSTTLWTNQALDWVRLNHDQVDPPIRVVTNSWTTGTTYDPNAYSSKVVRDLVDAGVVVVFSAGNDGGDGSSIRTSGEAQNPREGVISVGSYDDHDDGRQNGGLASSSSRGKTLVASSWPDVSAPGVTISSTKAAISAGGLGVLTAYKELSGTSQAAPHVAGVVALILQANPDLTPAQVEAILEGTAYAFGIGYAKSADDRYDGSHYAKGHGLVDAWEAVEAAKAW
jgi:serine protease AprX